ncbi:MAG TPA: hypothetical protein PKV50_03870, partial [Prolixibacteraceae bacterium]|nr:hypothetical protein [Prolixibacteraceae bacterium]
MNVVSFSTKIGIPIYFAINIYYGKNYPRSILVWILKGLDAKMNLDIDFSVIWTHVSQRFGSFFYRNLGLL